MKAFHSSSIHPTLIKSSDFLQPDLSTVGYDLLSISPLRMASSPLMSQHYNSHSTGFSPNVPIYNPNISNSGADGLSDSQVTINPILTKDSIDSSTSPVAISRNIINNNIATTFSTTANNLNRTGRSEETSAAHTHYLRLIVAERELNNKLQQEAQHRNGGRAVPLM